MELGIEKEVRKHEEKINSGERRVLPKNG